MNKTMKKIVAYIIITLCLSLLSPLAAMASPLPDISDYSNLPDGYQAMATKDEENSVKGTYSYLLSINERLRNLEDEETEYARSIFYDFTNLPENSYYYSSQRQDFDNGYIYQSPGAAMYYNFTDKVTGVEEFIERYKLITDEEYSNTDSYNIPDSIKVDTIGDYQTVHATIIYEDVEGYFQNDHYFIPLSTPIAHYGTAYLMLIISNDVRVGGDIKIDDIPIIYDQWLTECLELTEGWKNEFMKFSYTVRADDFIQGPISDMWAPPDIDSVPADEAPTELVPEKIDEIQSSDDEIPMEEPETDEEITPSPEPQAKNDSVESVDRNDTVDNDDEGSKSDDYADPLEAAIITIISILISILFGGSGGHVPDATSGVNGDPASPASDRDLGKWISFDDKGDIEATDPVNGEKRTFIYNGDGTYTDPISGATYTPEELSQQMKHREDNANTIRQDEKQFEENVNEDSRRNQELSEDSKRLEEDLRRERAERAHKEKVERVATNLGMSGASEDEVKKELKRRLERDEEFRQKMHDYAERHDIAVDILESTVDIADYAMSAGEALGGVAGKTISATYKGVKNTVSTVAEKGLSAGTVLEGVIKGGTEAATTVMNSGIGKAGVTIGGTLAGEVAAAVNDGTDLGDAIKDGIIKGTGNAAIGAVGDAIGDAVEGDGLLNKALETAEKLAETAYGKEIVDPAIDELMNKGE